MVQPDDGRRSDQNMSVNSNIWSNIFYGCSFVSLLHMCKFSSVRRYGTYKDIQIFWTDSNKLKLHQWIN